MNKTTLEKLHYYELKEIIKAYCISGLGKMLIDKLEPISNMKVVNQRLNETSEGRALIDASYNIPLKGIFNILPLIDKVEKGAFLEAEDLTMISNFLRGCRKVILPCGCIGLEIGYNQGEAVSELLRQNNFKDVNVMKDFNGLDRVVIGHL